ncbi:MAG TPA: sulfite exporter TauE/SafE family protein [Candidatus Stackebrandtia excrementipullorum]|nr:sulfite exporter TauE/SafE family protein [Candidatus Stackebrandtia excrementipullorum]
MDLTSTVLLLVAGLAAGSVNALAGGGSLITYPALLATGLPPVAANVTNSIAVCPGYLAAVAGSRQDLRGERRRTLRLVPTAIVGTVLGTALLLLSPPEAFEAVVPFLVIAAALTLAFQKRIRGLVGQPHTLGPRRQAVMLHLLVGVGCVYGGYFGAALGVMLVAGLALVLPDTLARVSALKNVLSAVVGLVAIVVYGLAAPVSWLSVAILAPTAVVGGFLGAKLARRLPQAILRGFIVGYGLVIGVYLLVS